MSSAAEPTAALLARVRANAELHYQTGSLGFGERDDIAAVCDAYEAAERAVGLLAPIVEASLRHGEAWSPMFIHAMEAALAAARESGWKP